MEVAVREAGLSPHIKCFAHTLNLASQAGLNVSRVSCLLGRVRKVVAFFHRSATATAVLAEKQKMLEIASHKLIMDVVTRWNSSMDMLERYLEQQAAITAALLSTEVRKNARQLDTLDSNDITDAEEIVNLLKPLKKATTVLSDEKSATLSLIVPLNSMMEQSMTLDEKDSTTIANMKAAILQNLSGRYTEVQDYLLESTALDPRFRSLPHLLPEQREEVFHRLMDKSNQLQQAVEQSEKREGGASDGDPTDAAEKRETTQRVEQEQPPPSKKTALEDLLGATFSKPTVTQSKCRMEVELDVYKKDTSIPLTSCPLKWWKEHAQTYPLLSSLSKAYLTVPATSVPSERVFSTAGDIVNAQRSQLLPENVDMLFFLQKNL
ncbi:zinc finger BED domain-containing protein 4 isoform X1 [Sinocyclocheilus rhinocerous]|uniref:zinc finger BED domain-containing protein 4 isoform X1 n=1 Tax=Sinocyclocheilus rhinocerous TaxID=307959 RepID=UPI0007B7B795|nr:PREDICTED: zinc finger BED domain-containing protein 4-like isoform X1 [Sinocyclocheilus rhinocerous]